MPPAIISPDVWIRPLWSAVIECSIDFGIQLRLEYNPLWLIKLWNFSYGFVISYLRNMIWVNCSLLVVNTEGTEIIHILAGMQCACLNLLHASFFKSVLEQYLLLKKSIIITNYFLNFLFENKCVFKIYLMDGCILNCNK